MAMLKMNTFTLDGLDKYDPDSIEECINELTRDDILTWINTARQRAMSPDYVDSEVETRTALLLVRRLRSLRETNTKVRKAKVENLKANPPSLSDLGADLF